ncbi:5-bromo-4-chloroindolyl phosphate hydrolysis protein [Butyrivibrio hungatei DSM 14810]|uniref:5-bromo-4-chloroindolyl phosphate hydrolysis protein n=1 Tax=Butyrivibrio hungatei DSM 14810 TaxID=1121132 RepID=A0A1M7SU94_9FIRM|nr:5-bromo-4-chloroindolyl phosphate hydrolysis family protein [Butyrivibrio hungatei]SHN62113.1 5-bromo-4-chloroindolyl phosphate hydrolysis protein [Butyrivibrio hungatei DSM 14810]
MEKNTEEITREIIDSSVKAGQDILQSVSNAINKNDYSKLASEITDAVKAVSIPQRTIYSSGRKEYYQHKYSYNQNPAAAVKTSYPFFAKKVSRYDGVLSIVFSSLVGFFGALPLLICGIVFSAIFGGAWLWMLVTGIASMGACLLWLFGGIKKLKLAKLFHKFGNIIKDKEYFKVSELAQQVVKTDKEVTKDLKEMVKAGYLPRAKFDSTETTFMITDAAYQMYLGAEKDRLAREKKELDQQKASLGVNATTRANLTGVEGLIAEGEDYIRFVRATNDIIPDTEQMSDKLYRLENIMNRIFEKVKKNPGSADDLHKLMNYYLPTTKKLLDAYVELDKQAGVGENVQQTKAEISTAMDTINEAFEKLLDSMFQDMAWDISSDISVMKTMMAQDGLTTEGQGMAMQLKQD